MCDEQGVDLERGGGVFLYRVSYRAAARQPRERTDGTGALRGRKYTATVLKWLNQKKTKKNYKLSLTL